MRPNVKVLLDKLDDITEKALSKLAEEEEQNQMENFTIDNTTQME